MSQFQFKQFTVDDGDCAMKVGTDSVLLGSWADVDNAKSVVDIGTGSGLLALMVAQRAAQAHILGIETDADAAKTARENFARSPWAHRLTAIQADALKCDIHEMLDRRDVDLIICNPPYFSNGLLSPDERRAEARHTSGRLGPETALEIASRWLNDTGSIAMVTPADYDDAVTYAAEMHHMKVWRKCMVSSVSAKAPSRILWQISRDRQRRYECSAITVRHQGEYTEEYRTLTSVFYLNF